MERMEGVDAGYLYMEQPAMHMHTVKVAFLEREGGIDIERFGQEVLARLDRLPPFGRRVLNVPFRLNHPVWVSDRPLDMRRHIVQQALPRPGGMKELQMTNVVSDSVGEIYATKKGELRLITSNDETSWVKAGKKNALTRVPVEDNVKLIYSDLGVYPGSLGTPCDDM